MLARTNRRRGQAAFLSLGFTLACGPRSLDAPVDTEGDSSPTGADGADSDGSRCAGLQGPRVSLPPEIAGDMELTCDTVWVLEGLTAVTAGTLTIERGTFIVGGAGSTLVIEPSARIDAQGTPASPVVMTSIIAAGGGTPARGDWGGLVMAGHASTNAPAPCASCFPTEMPWGGDDLTHDCGTLRHVRVEWSGNELSPGYELAAISLFACGTGTTLDHVQAHMPFDDGFDVVGGGFDGSHWVVTGAVDDGLDLDQGFEGTLSHVFVQQDPAIGHACLELTNNPESPSAEPITTPTIRNLTCVGSGPGGGKSTGVVLGAGARASIEDSLFADLTGPGVVMTSQVTQSHAQGGGISFAGTHFCDGSTYDAGTIPDDPDAAGWTNEDLRAWLLGAGGASDGTACPFASTAWGSPDISMGAATPAGSAGHAGAVPPSGDDWTQQAWIVY